MSIAAVVVGLYGAFSLLGGVIGYVKAKSQASLVAGSVSGTLLLVCAYGIHQGNRAAAVSTLLIALALGGRFASTWRRTHRVMPDLGMVLFSLATLAAVGVHLLAR